MEYKREKKEADMILEVTEDRLKKEVKALNQMIANWWTESIEVIFLMHHCHLEI